MLRELRVLLRRSFRHPDESIKRGLIYTSVCDHSGTATVNGVARSELTPPCSNTHMQMHAHMCNIYTCTAELTHTHACVHILTAIRSCSHTPAHTHVHKSISAYKVLGETEGKGEGGIKVCRERNPNVFLSVYLIWTFSTCFIHSALSAGIWGPEMQALSL